MHSPVYHVYEPVNDTTDDVSDWDLYDSDEYYDQGPSTKLPNHKIAKATEKSDFQGSKRRRADQGGGHRKKRRLFPTNEISEASRDESAKDGDAEQNELIQPILVWSKRDVSPGIPVLVHGDGERVALMKNWRERTNRNEPRRNSVGSDSPVRNVRSRSRLRTRISHGPHEGKSRQPLEASTNSQLTSRPKKEAEAETQNKQQGPDDVENGEMLTTGANGRKRSSTPMEESIVVDPMAKRLNLKRKPDEPDVQTHADKPESHKNASKKAKVAPRSTIATSSRSAKSRKAA